MATSAAWIFLLSSRIDTLLPPTAALQQRTRQARHPQKAKIRKGTSNHPHTSMYPNPTSLFMAPTSGDPNAAWRFASLHGSSIGTNTEARHPFSESVQEYYYPTNEEVTTALQEEYSTKQQQPQSAESESQNEADKAQAKSMLKQKLRPMPKQEQGVYQLTNEAEYP